MMRKTRAPDKMKKLARNLLKTADEKLRSIGKTQQPATSVQTQNFTFVRHNSQSQQHQQQQQQEENSPSQYNPQLQQQQEQHIPQSQQQKPREQHHHQNQGRRLSEQEIIQEQVEQELKRTTRQEHHRRYSDDQRRSSVSAVTAETVGEEGKRLQGKSGVTFMAERAIASRNARRDRNGPDNLERAEVKRRSRSEGPVKGRVRHSMDERGGRAGKKQTFDGGGRVRGFCIDDEDSESSGDVSDPGRPYYRGGRGVRRPDSDSDSDRQHWTKNPLVVVRRAKRSDKHARNRLSGGSGLTSGAAAESGSNTGSFYGNEDAAASSGGGGGGGGGSGSGGRSKYQRLEEMRRRRINMAATSDEEGAATPAVRISRLRQRALQSGLGGEPVRPSSNITPSNSFKGFNNGMGGGGGGGGGRNIDKFPAPLTTNFVPLQREISNTSTSSSSLHQPYNVSSQLRQQPEAQIQSKGTLVYTPHNPGSIQPPVLGVAAQRSQFTPRDFQARHQPLNTQFGITSKEGQASFFTIPDPNNSQTARALYSSSPDMASHRFTTHTKVPSADSVIHPVSQGRFSSIESPTIMSKQYSRGGVQQTNPTLIPSQVHEVVEMRLKASSKNTNQVRPKSQSKIPKKGIIQKLGLSEDYEDSLDELIESNIQYLDTEIDKASKVTKRASIPGSNVSRFSDSRKASLGTSLTSATRDQFQELQQFRHEQNTPPQQQQQQKQSHHLTYQHQQPAIQVQANTSIQLHVSLPGEPKDSVPPRIHIAPYPLQAETTTSTTGTRLDHMQPDVVPRKYSYDSRALRIQRPTSEYQYWGDRDDLSKSDSQLNSHVIQQPQDGRVEARMVMSSAGSLGTNRPLQYLNPAYQPRGCVSDMNLSSEPKSTSGPAVSSASNNNVLQVLQVDKGMFSDVEYDIEVSERVKKWETFMKDRDAVVEKKTTLGSLNLEPIQENIEASNEPLMLPSAVRRSVLLNKTSSSQASTSSNSISAFSSSLVSANPVSAFSYSTTDVTPYTPPVRHRPFSSDTSINKLGEEKLMSVDNSSTQRFFQSIQDPMSGGYRLGPFGPSNISLHGAQSTSSLFHQQGPIKIRTSYADDDEKSLMSAQELRNQMLSHRQPLLPLTGSGPLQAVHQPSQFVAAPLQISSISSTSTPPPQQGCSSNNTPVVVRRRKTSRDGGADPRDTTKRGSKYQDELEEISNVRTDSVGNLRKRFDPDSAAMTSEDDQRSVVSTASAKLSRPGKLSAPTSSRASVQRSGGESSSTDWASMIPGYEKKIRDSDVWSPNLESTQGVPVSIERVTARTLQTIPFSEDPFWKELEEMTSFDPSSMAGNLSLSASQEGGPTPTEPFTPLKSHHLLNVPNQPTPHSSTLPAASSLTHSRNNAMSSKDRLQRSKSLYTPNFTPLSIDVDRTSSSAVSALDEVLDDINRSSMERKQLSPKKKLETNINLSPTKASGYPQNYFNSQQDIPSTTFKYEDGQFKFMKSTAAEPSKKFETGNLIQMRAEQALLPQKQPMQFYQLQRHQQQQQQLQQQQQYRLQTAPQDQKANRQSQTFNNVNNYQLDPNLLKEKLLNTGLVVETDTEDNAQASTSSSRGPSAFSHATFTPVHNPLSIVNSTSSGFADDKSNSNSSLIRPGSFYANIANPPSVSSRPETEDSDPSNPFQGRSRVGRSALDDIQRALAPFSNTTTSYQPGPESLYGTAKLESFRETGLNTTSGPNTQPTSWAYQPSKKASFLSSAGGVPGSSSDDAASSSSRLQQVNASMDDLKDLAQNVERRINVIKTRLQSADEGSLDTILSSLKNLQPETDVRRGGDGAAAAAGDADPASSTFEDYYTTKKSKLSKALTELDRIYKNLELNSDDMTGLPDKTQPHHQYKLYRPTRSSDFVLASQPKSEHLRPMQTRITSVYIPGLEKQKKEKENQGALDKETESEFDVISKSFQAIVDEVNQTSNLLSKSNEENRRQNLTAPEAQKRTFKITLQSEDQEKATVSGLPAETSNALSTSNNESSQTAPKAEDDTSTKSRPTLGTLNFTSQISTYDNVKKEEAVQTNTKESGDASIQTLNEDKTENDPTSSGQTQVPSSSKAVASAAAAKPSTQPATRQRVRPVRDNKIVQEDKKASAIRREAGSAGEKVLGMPPSPGPSPKFSRKIIYNNAADLETKIIKPPEMFQDEPSKPEDGSSTTSKTQTTASKLPQEKTTQPLATKQTNQNQKQKQQIKAPSTKKPDMQKKLQLDVKQTTPATVSPSTVRKVPPPIISRSNTKTTDTVALSPKGPPKNQQESTQVGSIVGQRKPAASPSIGEKKQIGTSGVEGGGDPSVNSSKVASKFSKSSVATISLSPPADAAIGGATSTTLPQKNQFKLENTIETNATSTTKNLDSTDEKPSPEKIDDTEVLDEDDDVFLDASAETAESKIFVAKDKETKDKTPTAIPKFRLKTPVKTPPASKEKVAQSTGGSPRVPVAAAKSPLQLRRMGPKTTEVKKTSAPAPDGTKKLIASPDKKPVSSENDYESAKSHGSPSAPQTPTSPGNKPPLHPWKRPPSDSEKPSAAEVVSSNTIGAATSQSPAASPKVSSKIPRPVGAEPQNVYQQGQSKMSGDLNKTPTQAEILTSVLCKEKEQGNSEAVSPDRPRSFHEREGAVDEESKRSGRDRKCMSAADAGNSVHAAEGAHAPAYRSEPILSEGSVVTEIAVKLEGDKEEACP